MSDHHLHFRESSHFRSSERSAEVATARKWRGLWGFPLLCGTKKRTVLHRAKTEGQKTMNPSTPEEALSLYLTIAAERERKWKEEKEQKDREQAEKNKVRKKEEEERNKERQKVLKQKIEACEKELKEKDPVNTFFNFVLNQVRSNTDLHARILKQIAETGEERFIVASGNSVCCGKAWSDYFKIPSIQLSADTERRFDLITLFDEARPKARVETGPFAKWQLKTEIDRHWWHMFGEGPGPSWLLVLQKPKGGCSVM